VILFKQRLKTRAAWLQTRRPCAPFLRQFEIHTLDLVAQLFHDGGQAVGAYHVQAASKQIADDLEALKK